jgi:Mg2+/Co2+ transporter CorB
MKQIATYRENSPMKTKLHAFLHNHKKTIAAVVTGIGAVGGIIGTLLSIKQSI